MLANRVSPPLGELIAGELPGQVGDTEDLFDLRGHSITMTQISARLLDRLGVDVPLDAYFEAPTVQGIAAVVAEPTRQNQSPAQKMNQR
uniref:Acyl carrier protein n=1 Tax=Streptomyces sp. NBC_00003 TaxID=2903608 RepID=A0AAU2VDS5_9ACTN